jgi:hypothetical protein
MVGDIIADSRATSPESAPRRSSTGVDPVRWTPFHLRRRCHQCRRVTDPMHRNSFDVPRKPDTSKAIDRCAIYRCRNAPKGRSWQPTPGIGGMSAQMTNRLAPLRCRPLPGFDNGDLAAAPRFEITFRVTFNLRLAIKEKSPLNSPRATSATRTRAGPMPGRRRNSCYKKPSHGLTSTRG